MPKGKDTVLHDIPAELISEAMKSYQRCLVGIKRTNEKGQWATLVSGLEMDTADLLGIDAFCQQHAAGGKFRITTTSTTDRSKAVLPPFYVSVEGPPRPYTGPGKPEPPAPPTQAYGGVPGYPPPPPGWPPRGPGYFGGRGFDNGRGIDPKKFQSHTPDEIALMHADDLRTRLSQMQEEWKADRIKWEEEKKRLEEMIATLREDAVKVAAAHREEVWEARFQLAQQKPQSFDIAGMLTAVVPLATAMMSTSKERDTSAAAQQTKVLESTMGLLGNALQSNKKEGDGIKHLAAVIPAVLPVIKDMMESRGPKAQVEMLGTMGDQMLTQMSMVSQIMELAAAQQPDQSPMAMLLQELGNGLNQYAQVMMRSAGATQEVPVQAQAHPAAPEPAPRQVEPGDDPDGVWSRLPEYFRTQEWAAIVFHLQRAVAGTEEAVATMIAGHVENLDRLGTSPEPLAKCIEEGPSAIRTELLERLPNYDADRAFMDGMYARLLVELADPAADAPAVVTPAPVVDVEAEPVAAPPDKPAEASTGP